MPKQSLPGRSRSEQVCRSSTKHTGQITSYRPCTTIVGICRLHTYISRSEREADGPTCILSMLCSSKSWPSRINPYRIGLVFLKYTQRISETNLVDEIMVLDACKCTMHPAVRKGARNQYYRHTVQTCLPLHAGACLH